MIPNLPGIVWFFGSIVIFVLVVRYFIIKRIENSIFRKIDRKEYNKADMRIGMLNLFFVRKSRIIDLTFMVSEARNGIRQTRRDAKLKSMDELIAPMREEVVGAKIKNDSDSSP